MPTRDRRCPKCDAPWEGDGFCPTCEAEFTTPTSHQVPALEWMQTFPAPPAAVGRHVAGPRGLDQFCTRCGGWLCSQRIAGIEPTPAPGTVPFTSYPAGAVIERGGNWQAMNLSADGPTCDARRL